MNKEYTSRNQLFNKEIDLVNQQIKSAKSLGNYTKFINNSLNVLTKLDEKYFTNSFINLYDEFEKGSFYLAKTKISQTINQELLNNIDKQINLLKNISTNDLVDLKNYSDFIVLDEQKFHFVNLLNMTKDIEFHKKTTSQSFESSKIINNDFTNLTKANFEQNDLKQVQNNNDLKQILITDLIKKTKSENLKKIFELERKKQMYQIKKNWFLIWISIFIAIMIFSLLLFIVL
ncbi:hypothetical protein [Mycoplasma mycoides]|uniref:Transmembrane protein n=1 Tax=Mycoplasma mycoides subsp. capri TaxID=40477 RepID=A0AB38GEF6_MYCMC|nr:hypothetical protein [Mycoplasma mycoides]ADH21571.1 conserved hypothetical protein [synthetic Mycoplasma mycoides JCVI-syn1.0]AMW76444.1 hypothetical protein JCVISYN3_0346 [synthetic bacterium JCVI-Syn3.0]AMW76903.1 hypothetical protein JCVISYN2_0346 [synthetic bacterium JCVI-Syn2.0]AVX54730.1 Uncharacterized protein JCVISYN3A_0346 [synthetic bacterium JCVI-Syn3A]QWN46419.1 hypothetical protein JOY38_00870 [synthetic bacterium JCVI-Syn3B]